MQVVELTKLDLDTLLGKPDWTNKAKLSASAHDLMLLRRCQDSGPWYRNELKRLAADIIAGKL